MGCLLSRLIDNEFALSKIPRRPLNLQYLEIDIIMPYIGDRVGLLMLNPKL